VGEGGGVGGSAGRGEEAVGEIKGVDQEAEAGGLRGKQKEGERC
jgi:hypothetical protein